MAPVSISLDAVRKNWIDLLNHGPPKTCHETDSVATVTQYALLEKEGNVLLTPTMTLNICKAISCSRSEIRRAVTGCLHKWTSSQNKIPFSCSQVTKQQLTEISNCPAASKLSAHSMPPVPHQQHCYYSRILVKKLN